MSGLLLWAIGFPKTAYWSMAILFGMMSERLDYSVRQLVLPKYRARLVIFITELTVYYAVFVISECYLNVTPKIFNSTQRMLGSLWRH